MKNILIVLALISSFVLVGCPAKEVEAGELPTTAQTEQAGTGETEIPEPN